MTDDQHPDVLAEATITEPDAAERVRDINLDRIGEALTGWSQVALDRELRGLDLHRQDWVARAKVWVRPAGGRFGAGFLRINLRAVAERKPVIPSTEAAASTADAVKPLTEEHHAVVDLTELAADGAVVAGLLQEALGELARIVAAPLRRRLLAAGVRELTTDPTCDHSPGTGNRGALRCTVCGALIGRR